MNPIIAPSILAADFLNLENEIKAIEKTDAKWLHLDIMDGHFVPNITFGYDLVKKIREITSLFLDVHLMITNPELYIDKFAMAGADNITFHIETLQHHHRLIQQIHKHNIKAGISLNPSTPLSNIKYLLDDLDLILLMSVNPGFGGQAFIPQTFEKLSELTNILLNKNKQILIEVDGGINSNISSRLIEYGVNILVAGSFIFKQTDYKNAVNSLLSK